VNGALPTPSPRAGQCPQQRVVYLPAATVGFTAEKPVEQPSLSQRRICYPPPASANIWLTTAHVAQIEHIIYELGYEQLYLLALQLGLPQGYRLTLLWTTANEAVVAKAKVAKATTEEEAAAAVAAHKGGHECLVQLLGHTLPEHLFTHQQLLAALVRIGRTDLAEMHCDQFNILFDYQHYDSNTLQCEEPGHNGNSIDQVLSHFDLCQIFTGRLPGLRSIPLETLAQTTGYPQLLNDPQLPYFKDENTLAVCRLLENIVAGRKQSLTVREAVAILCKPEIGQINIAHRLINAFTSRKPNEGAPPAVWDDQQSLETFRLISKLGGLKYPLLDVATFASALGVPDFKMEQMQPLTPNTSTLMNVIFQARQLREQLSAGHILYALEEAATVCDALPRLREIQRLHVPMFHQTTACKPPAISAPLAVTEVLTQVPDSKPLTKSFLGGLLLSHNWVLIGLAMGLSAAELEEIGESAKPDARLTAFYLSAKLTEPHRQLETGDLYQALLQLNDQEALRYFPKRLSSNRSTELPKAVEQAMTSGLKTAKVLREEGQTQHLSHIDPLLEREWVNNGA